MNHILESYLRRFVLTFFDDILVYSSSWKEHLQHLKVVFQVLQQQHFFAKPSKCSFGKTEINYLGHIISGKGMSTNPKKVTVMLNWLVPKSIKDLRNFLELTGYYRKFVEHYGLISKSLTDLLKKDSFR